MSANRGDNNVHLIFAIIHDTDKLSLLNPNFFMHLHSQGKYDLLSVMNDKMERRRYTQGTLYSGRRGIWRNKRNLKNDILFINIRNLKVIFDKRNIVFIVSK